MRIDDIDKLKAGDYFLYHGQKAQVTWVRPKEDHLAIGHPAKGEPPLEDKSVCISFLVGNNNVCLVSRLDSKGTRMEKRDKGVVEVLTMLDLPQYEPYGR